MDKESYCKLHDTYPKDGKPCWQCINACRPGFDFYRQLQAENKELKAWQKNMQNEVDMAHDAEIELLALREKTEQLKEALKYAKTEILTFSFQVEDTSEKGFALAEGITNKIDQLSKP